MGMSVGVARPSDLPALTHIYNHYVVHTPITFDTAPFSVDQRRSWYAEHTDGGPHRLFVARDDDGGVLGYASSSAFRPKPAYATSVETSVYCDPGARGGGTGTVLYRALLSALVEPGAGAHRAYAGVALPNAASLALHRRFGFRDVGTYREVGYKFGRYWDVRWLELALDHPPFA